MKAIVTVVGKDQVGIIAAVALIVFMCVECAKKEKYDIEAVAFTYSYIADDQLKILAEEMEKYCEDIDGDGKANVMPINCTYAKNSSAGATTQYTASTKVQALLAADKQALVFITDKESYEFLNGVDEENPIFVGEPIEVSEELYKKVKDKTGYDLPEGLLISYRRVSGTTLEKEKKVADYYEQAKSIVQGLKGEN